MMLSEKRLCVGIGTLVLIATISTAQEEKAATPPREDYHAIAVALGNIATGTTVPVDIAIMGWTSPEERAELIQMLKDEGGEKTLKVLRKKPELGFIRPSSRIGVELRYAWQTQVGDKRRVVLVTDRPIYVFEGQRRGRTLDYGYSLVSMDLDAEGNGEGIVIVGAMLEYDKEKDVLNIEAYDTAGGVRLTNITRWAQKDKKKGKKK
jgi:hypothetical protein